MSRDEKIHRVTLTRREGFEFEATFDGFEASTPLTFDEPEPLGRGRHPNAAAVLSAAIGNCLGASLLYCLQRSRADVGGVTARVKTRIARNEAGRYRIKDIEVELVPEVAGDDHGRLARCGDLFEDFCIVTESVRAGIPVEVTVKEAALSVEP